VNRPKFAHVIRFRHGYKRDFTILKCEICGRGYFSCFACPICDNETYSRRVAFWESKAKEIKKPMWWNTIYRKYNLIYNRIKGKNEERKIFKRRFRIY